MDASRATGKTTSTIGGALAFLCNLVSKVHMAHGKDWQDPFISVEENNEIHIAHNTE
jgi:hypothetical protein